MAEESDKIGWTTPTYTSIICFQLRQVLETRADGDPIQSFVVMRDLILLLPPEISLKLVENDITHINQRLGTIDDAAADIILKKAFNSTQTRKILAEENLALFQKVMLELHKSGLLIEHISPRYKAPKESVGQHQENTAPKQE
ncbi:MAG: hypothetical protein WCD81_08580 [Candidatus Bathyarchaeia archaeon]